MPLTITLWNKIQAKMLPTPAKFHYLFNMRELSKVFQGVILAARDRCAHCKLREIDDSQPAINAYLNPHACYVSTGSAHQRPTPV